VSILRGLWALDWAWQKVFDKSIEIYKANKNMKKYKQILQKCGRFVGGALTSVYKRNHFYSPKSLFLQTTFTKTLKIVKGTPLH